MYLLPLVVNAPNLDIIKSVGFNGVQEGRKYYVMKTDSCEVGTYGTVGHGKKAKSGIICNDNVYGLGQFDNIDNNLLCLSNLIEGKSKYIRLSNSRVVFYIYKYRNESRSNGVYRKGIEYIVVGLYGEGVGFVEIFIESSNKFLLERIQPVMATVNGCYYPVMLLRWHDDSIFTYTVGSIGHIGGKLFGIEQDYSHDVASYNASLFELKQMWRDRCIV